VHFICNLHWSLVIHRRMVYGGGFVEQQSVVDPDLELSGGRWKGEGGPCFVLLALSVFLPSVISSIFTPPPPEKIGAGPPDPSPPRLPDPPIKMYYLHLFSR